jgi:hypothetical protein
MEEFGTLFAGGLGLIIILVLLVAAVLAFLIPFFILKIRNEVISINGKMDIIIKLLRGESAKTTETGEKVVASTPAPDGMKYCGYCGDLNGRWDETCVKCGKPV